MKYLLIISLLFSSFANAQDSTSFNLQVGSGSKYASINVVDKVTGNYVTATISNVVVQNNNPELASISVNASNVIKATGVKAGTGTATVTCNVSYTDAGDGLTKNETKTIQINYVVIGAPNGVKLSLTFN